VEAPPAEKTPEEEEEETMVEIPAEPAFMPFVGSGNR